MEHKKKETFHHFLNILLASAEAHIMWRKLLLRNEIWVLFLLSATRNIIAKARGQRQKTKRESGCGRKKNIVDGEERQENLSFGKHGTIMLKRTFHFVGNNLGISHFLLAFLAAVAAFFPLPQDPPSTHETPAQQVWSPLLFSASTSLLLWISCSPSGLPNVGLSLRLYNTSSNPYHLY